MSHKKTSSLQFKQQGNSLIGLMAGLVLATLILIAVLLVLNSNSKRDFKHEPALNNAPNAAGASKDKLMLPQSASQSSQVGTATQQQSASETKMSSQAASEAMGESVLGVRDNKYPDNSQNAQNTADNINSSANTNDGATGAAEDKKVDNTVAPPKTTGLSNGQQEDKFRQPSHNLSKNGNNTPSWRDDNSNSDGGVSKNHNTMNNNAHTIKRPQDLPTLVDKHGALIEHPSTASKTPNYRPVRPSNNDKVVIVKPKPQVVKPQQPKAPVQTNIKPSPELILESGNIEKAREAARRQAAAKNNSVKSNESKPAATQAPTATNQHGNVVLQAGSFVNVRSADAQRARLAMMGIQAKVVEAQVNGKSVYRVQTHGLNGNKAAETKNTLQRNGIQVYQPANH